MDKKSRFGLSELNICGFFNFGGLPGSKKETKTFQATVLKRTGPGSNPGLRSPMKGFFERRLMPKALKEVNPAAENRKRCGVRMEEKP